MSDTTSLTQDIAPTIEFTQIPDNILVPGNYVEIDADYSNIGLLPFPARALLIGQGSPAGTATKNKIYTINRPGQGAGYFGAGSPLADQIAAWFAVNPGIPLDAATAGAPTGGATNAAGSITFGGAATVVASQAIAIAGYRIPFTISPGDTPSQMAANFMDAAAAIYNAQNLPVDLAAVGAGPAVTVTAGVTGAVGNEYDIRINPADRDVTVPGVTIAVVQPTGGTGVPDITPLINAIATTWYTDISLCFTDPTSLGILIPALAERFGAMQVKDSQAYIAMQGTQGALATDVAGLNSQYLALLGVTNPQQPTWIWSAALMAVASFALMNDPARQLRSLPLPGIIAPARSDRMYEPEQQALLQDGVSTFDVDQGNNVILQRIVSTYTTSELGVPDTAWQDIMTAKVLSRIRWDWRNYLSLVYPRNKLADDGSLAAEYDASVATPRRLKGAWAARCKLYEQAGWIENSAVTSAASVFVRDPNSRNQVNAQLQVQIIGNLMVNAQQLVFAAQ